MGTAALASASAARACTSSRASTSAPASTNKTPLVARRRRPLALSRTTNDVDGGTSNFARPRFHLVPIARASPGREGSVSSSESDGEGGSSGSGGGPESLEDREARLAALERGARRKGGAAARSLAQQSYPRSPSNSRPAGPANWPEGQLLPDGWEDMSLAQRTAELYQGRRGFLFWASQAAWYSAIGVGFGWVLFRFVLPGIGLYKLANGLTDAPTPL